MGKSKARSEPYQKNSELKRLMEFQVNRETILVVGEIRFVLKTKTVKILFWYEFWDVNWPQPQGLKIPWMVKSVKNLIEMSLKSID